jgi:hypothetical protein
MDAAITASSMPGQSGRTRRCRKTTAATATAMPKAEGLLRL